MTKSLRTLILCAAASLPVAALAIPANPKPVVFSQADGSTVTVTLHGDETFSYYMTADGFVLQPYAADMLGYVTVGADGNLRTIPTPARDAAFRSAAEKATLASINQEAVKSAIFSAQSQARKAKRNVTIGSIMNDYPTIGSPNALVLLVEYSDYPFQTANANEEFNKLMNSRGYDHNGATGSCLDYFIDNSMGLFTPEFRVYGPITLPHTMAYYGAASGNSYDTRPWDMLSDGCKLLKEQHPEINFADFDNDGDGVVDNVFIFYAGYGQNNGASTNTVWPHAACYTWYGNCEIDGVKLDSYACTNELNGKDGKVRTGIGTFCHEFSHVLGLPDLYATDGSTPFTPGSWELMDIGPYNNNGNTPPYMSAFDRFSVRWLNPRELTAPETVVLNPISQNEAYLISTILDTEFYLFENRQQTGWDKYIPGHGMLAWHIDYDAEVWKNNKVNVRTVHQCVDIVEADNILSDGTRAADTFPGLSEVTSFTDDTTPAMSTWTGVRIGKPITDIKEVSGVISFRVLGGGDGVPAVTALDPVAVGPVSFTAAWQGDVTASGYEIDVFLGQQPVPFATYSCQPKSLDDCKYEVTGLNPSTEYSYTVRALDGNMKSADSNRVSVTTIPPTFDMLTPQNLRYENLDGTAFTAKWDALDGADGYELSVYTKTFNKPVVDSLDFTGGIDALPTGWSTICTSVSSVAGTYGESRPSLALKNDGDDLQSPLYDFNVNSFEFWCAAAKDTEATLSVEGWNGSKWVSIETIVFSGKTDGRTYAFDDSNAPVIKTGCTRIRLTLHRTAGSIYIDDVKLAYNGDATFHYADGYEAYPVSGTEALVKGLLPKTLYYFTVTGTQGGLRSLVSEEKNLTTGESSGIESVTTDSSVEFVTAKSRLTIINHSGTAQHYEIVDPAGRIIAQGSCLTAVTLPLPTGLYLVTLTPAAYPNGPTAYTTKLTIP